jgi:glutathione synthase/RimK-type ligase-like ATP-grasp enzyme
MIEIIILTDYKGRFGSKSNDIPYRSGFNKKKIAEEFYKNNFKVTYISFHDIVWDKAKWMNKYVIYTSSEEKGLEYKSFIEDVILGLENFGAICLPNFLHLKANNNKVFMEIFAQSIHENLNLKSLVFGSIEETLNAYKNKIYKFPVVVKKAAGAKSRGVYLVKNEKELIQAIKKAQNTFSFKSYLYELLRARKHKGYQVESQYQNKIVIQPFIENLKNDWKVLIFSKDYYVLNRGIKKNDFRASGSGYNYKAGSSSEIPHEVLDYCKSFFEAFDIPNMSIDVAYDGEKCYIIEFQSLYFGTSTILMSDDFYSFEEGKWVIKPIEKDIEKIYANSIVNYLKNF